MLQILASLLFLSAFFHMFTIAMLFGIYLLKPTLKNIVFFYYRWLSLRWCEMETSLQSCTGHEHEAVVESRAFTKVNFIEINFIIRCSVVSETTSEAKRLKG